MGYAVASGFLRCGKYRRYLSNTTNAGNLATTAFVSTAFLLPFPIGGRFGSIWLAV